MPAKFVRSPKYIAPDGQEFDTLEEDMIHEISGLFTPDSPPQTIETMCQWIVNQREKILPILAQRERKHASPEARKTRKPRTPKTTATQPA